ncbi:MAG TPA: YidB family protein [Candidatus Solibacter sp.]|nr:YidB family protein [Candidatus Solibacter sp.]
MNFADVMKSLTGSQPGESASPAQTLLPSVLEMFCHGEGLNSVVRSFQQNGMGDIVRSWVGTGQNMPISPGQVQTALGRDTITEMAEKSGLSRDAVTSHLSQILPRLVDSLTPNGHTGDAADLMSKCTELLGSLMTRKSGA